MRAQRNRIIVLGRRVAEHGHFATHRTRQLHAHVPESAEAHDRDLVASLDAEMAQR